MSTGKCFLTVFVAVLLANALTLLALYFVAPQFGDQAGSGAIGALVPEALGPTRPSDEIAREWVPAIQSRIGQFWVLPPGSWDGTSAVLNVQLEPGGVVQPGRVQLVTSSGNPAFDQSVVAAVYDASPLPVPDGRDFAPFRDFNLVLRP